MYSCRDVMKLMYAFVDGELDGKETGRVQSHLQECVCCCDLFISEQAFLGLLKSNLRADSARTKACN